MVAGSGQAPQERVRGVRVRGIYATAITRLLLDNGIPVVDASDQIIERFGDEVYEGGVALVTVKDRDDRRGLVIVGAKPLVNDVLEALRKALPLSPLVVMPAELYATYLCRVIGGGMVELPGGVKGQLEGGGVKGELVVAHVVRFRGLTPVLRRGVMVVGEYARLVEGARHSVSEHIRGAERAMLLTLAMRAGLEGWGVRWRSSARRAEMSELLEELHALRRKAERVKESAGALSSPEKLSEGEVLAFIPLALEDKVRLDRVRGRQVSTLKYHHLFKACGERYSPLVDLLESFCECCDVNCLSKRLLRSIIADLRRPLLTVLHEKPGEGVIRIEGKATLLSLDPPIFKLERRIRGGGTYDGLGLPKEEGDRAVSLVTPFSHVLPHLYFDREGKLKGVYVNVNTPIEPCPPSSVWYIDVYVDVVWTQEGGVKIVDINKLRGAGERGVLSPAAVKKFEELAAQVADKLARGHDIDSLARLAVELSCEDKSS
ncbi:MAG: hypothetical protein DRK00_03860 [Thermoprotei archaeon]|nr:MAG: hypothetical protein DRK00_03860 [Thermoprotei archaeon]